MMAFNGQTLRIPLQNYKETNSARVPEGDYRLQIEDVELGESKGAKTNGAPMVTVSLRILDGEYAGSTIIDRLIIAPSTMFRVVGLLRGLGIPTPKKEIAVNPQSWVGKIVTATIKDNKYERNGTETVTSQVNSYAQVAVQPQGPQASAHTAAEDLDDLEAAAPAAEPAPEPTAPEQAPAAPEQAPVQPQAAPVRSDEIDLDQIEL